MHRKRQRPGLAQQRLGRRPVMESCIARKLSNSVQWATRNVGISWVYCRGYRLTIYSLSLINGKVVAADWYAQRCITMGDSLVATVI